MGSPVTEFTTLPLKAKEPVFCEYGEEFTCAGDNPARARHHVQNKMVQTSLEKRGRELELTSIGPAMPCLRIRNMIAE